MFRENPDVFVFINEINCNAVSVKTKMMRLFITICCLIAGSSGFGQIPDLPVAGRVSASNIFGRSGEVNKNYGNKSSQRLEPVIRPHVQNSNHLRAEEMIRKDLENENRRIAEAENYKKFMLAPLSGQKGTEAYYRAFENLSKLDHDNYSLAEAVFLVENAYYDNDKDFQKSYQSQIQRAVDIIRRSSNRNGTVDDNVSRNLAVFRYFAEDSKIGSKVAHKAIKYDFEDYMGAKDYSKMFVSKLMKKNSGQCHSMPLLYLILAEQIGAEAYLVMSPNHSYIRFEGDDGEMLSIELTNGMFSANSFVLNSGYIKAEALKNKLYMQNLGKKEVLSQTFVDLASGYIHKYGYDEFVAKVINKALQLNPNNINAHLWKSNTDQVRFMQSTARFGIDPQNNEQLQHIRDIPPLDMQYREINRGFVYIDSSGFAEMPAEQYQQWLGSMKSTENKQKSDEITERIQFLNRHKQSESLKKSKTITPKKEAPKTFRIPKEFL
ncbi:hypothetical protein DRF65_13910 [Chryseobacterium pennae]|uniref:Protein SirB1 N-terminal domain-containing protein n=2 Tax=Chryseobacterium pennae TaxID=2258962 RepID=A0A3D9C7Z8_9FLAO|nr:hypothetical protein DRF65_13910 [Chryseobacterium pennae]